MADKLSQNHLEGTFELVQDFVFRFIDHVDPEANQVKSTFSLSRFFGARILDTDCLLVAVAAIAFNPLFWNFAARNGILLIEVGFDVEWNNRTLTQTFGNKYTACYFLAVIIFVLGILRDYLYHYFIVGWCLTVGLRGLLLHRLP